MQTDQRLRFLRESPAFAPLGEAGLACLAHAARSVALEPGQMLFSQGEPAADAYVVAEGAVAVGVTGEDGRETHFADLGLGAVFGEAAVIDGGPRTAGVTARERSRLLRLPGPVLLTLLAEEPGFALALMRDLVAKLRAADAQIEDRSHLPLGARLAKFLAAGPEELRMTQAQIAER